MVREDLTEQVTVKQGRKHEKELPVIRPLGRAFQGVGGGSRVGMWLLYVGTETPE